MEVVLSSSQTSSHSVIENLSSRGVVLLVYQQSRHPPELTDQQSQSCHTESGHQSRKASMTAFACAAIGTFLPIRAQPEFRNKGRIGVIPQCRQCGEGNPLPRQRIAFANQSESHGVFRLANDLSHFQAASNLVQLFIDGPAAVDELNLPGGQSLAVQQPVVDIFVRDRLVVGLFMKYS